MSTFVHLLSRPSGRKGRTRDAKAQDSTCCPQAIDKENLSGHLCVRVYVCVCVGGLGGGACRVRSKPEYAYAMCALNYAVDSGRTMTT